MLQTGPLSRCPRFGAKTDVLGNLRNVRFTPEKRTWRQDGCDVCFVPKADNRVDCSIRKEEPPDVVRGFVVQMLFGRSVELIVKHETPIAPSVRRQAY